MVVKGANKMSRVNVPLDPTRTGREAEALEVGLSRMIVGQDEAIQQIVNIYQMYLTGMTPPGRPIGSFLFLGPTGSGKTRIVEAAAEWSHRFRQDAHRGSRGRIAGEEPSLGC